MKDYMCDILEDDTLIYISDCRKVSIYKNYNNSFFFDFHIDNQHIITDDILEAVVILNRLDNFINDSNIWNIEILDKETTIKYGSVLYWLLNIDINIDMYKYDWNQLSDIFIKKYKRTLISILKNSKNLNDIRKLFIKKLPLQSIYDYSIKKDLIK